ncbi:hypothetical protein U9K52_08760 [Chryseobacterium sp. MHB01]|uniref:hypothetical protein n=1 Tax=Chryseobacterium sp. MHB01 TaxID=3109433 RepID=UPI002AFE5FC7|nr:hypothetical protein [Chryseobacterium sp. MHB01]MEA1848998.1 hypothetical protein [Chryseobacterium sp. MHB01]
MAGTQQQLHLQEGKTKLTFWKIFSSILVIISGFLPFLDNILVFLFPDLALFKDRIGGFVRNDIWLLSLYISTIIVIIGRFGKAYNLTYYFPLFATTYSVVMYILMMFFGYNIDIEWAQRLGLVIMITPGMYVIYRLINYIKKLQLKDEIQFKAIERIVEKAQNENEKEK